MTYAMVALARALDAGALRDRLVASDPDRERLRMGLRAVLGAALSALVLSRAGARLGVPASVWLLGVSFAMSCAVFVPEGPPAGERRGFLVVPATAAVAAALAGLSAAAPSLVGDALALVVVFGAVWSRRFAAAGIGAGMAAFLEFFVARYFALRPAQVPAAIAAVVAGAAVAAAVRFGIVRRRPERAVPRTMAGLRLTVAVVMRRLARAVRARRSPRAARRFAADIDRLHEAALAVDDLLVRVPEAEAPSGAVGELRELAFALQTAAERVVQAIAQVVDSGALPPASRRAIAAALEQARRAARGDPAAAARVGPRLEDAGRAAAPPAVAERAARDLLRVRSSLADLAGAARAVREASTAGLPAPASAPPPPTAPPAVAGPLGLGQPTRQAIQATIAAALAMAAGARLSSTRWFWAVIAAFVMFVSATTVADTVQRAWLRVLGTVLGAAGGLLLGAAVAGHPRLELGAAFACVFFAYWLFRVSYAWLLFWFTALIAVLYHLLGLFTPQLLVLRIEETAVGAGIGVLVAAVVLPVRARARVREATAEALRATATWLDVAITARAAGTGDAPLDTARAMDERLRALRATARPVTGGTVGSPRAAHLVHGATAVVLHARHLAPGDALARMDAAARADVAEAGRRLAAGARRTAAVLDGRPAEEGAPDRGPAAEPIARAVRSLRGAAAVRAGPTTPPVWLEWLGRIDEALRDLATVAGTPGDAATRQGEPGPAPLGADRPAPRRS